MKNWIKYIFTSFLLIFLMSSNSYIFSKPTSSISSVNNKIAKKSTNTTHFVITPDSSFNLDIFMLELDEEDFSHSDYCSNFSLENELHQRFQFHFPDEYIWKKIKFRNKVLLSLQSKIYLQHCNFRI